MSHIFGIFSRSTDNTHKDVLTKVRNNLSLDDIDNIKLWNSENLILGQKNNKNFIGDTPVKYPLNTINENLSFIALGRVDNKQELCYRLNIHKSECVELPDVEIMHHAYITWGTECCARILGDWIFIGWDTHNKQLTVARSHYGCIALYYHIDEDILAFSTSRQLLLDLCLVPVEIDELWLGQYITSWHAHFGETTPHNPIKCLPPAHYLIATPRSYSTRLYWNPENNKELSLRNRNEYVEAFRTIFDESVRCRLCSDSPIAVSMSGGLDSSSVAVTAAMLLAADGKRLKAFTAIPKYESQLYLPPENFADELPFAQAVADLSGNIDLSPVVSDDINPITAIRHLLKIGRIPAHGATNIYWMMTLRRVALDAGCRVLLTGAAGNGAFSWSGELSSQSLPFLVRYLGWKSLMQYLSNRIKKQIKFALPDAYLISKQMSRMENAEWYRRTAIKPDFAKRINLLKLRLESPGEFLPSKHREEQSRIIRTGRAVVGGYSAEIAATCGLDVRDPTCDARIIDFVYSVPDRIFMDSETGIDRWLVRAAMKGRLPDEVRLNRRRGRQGADIIPRLRSSMAEVEDALQELADGPASEYVDVDYMRQIWQRALHHDTSEARIATSQILLRGIMAGLFVNNFYQQRR